jgi:Cdc6-like AAA superfamily ATPase
MNAVSKPCALKWVSPPSAVSRDLHQQILQADTLKSTKPTPTYPKYQTPLFGRDAELASLSRALQEEEVQLLTITGTGGIGKTRLVTTGRSAVTETVPHGVVFLSLASITTADLLIPTLATELGLTLGNQQPPDIQLTEALQGRQCLIVLDNFEHLMPGRKILAQLVEATPSCRWLVASANGSICAARLYSTSAV